MSEISDEIVKASKYDASGIVFSSRKDMKTFFDEIANGKYVIVDFPDPSEQNQTRSEMVPPEYKDKIARELVKIAAVYPGQASQ